MIRRAAPLCACIALVACQAESPDVQAVFDPNGAFFDLPWPADFRRTANGAPNAADFPNPTGVELVSDYVALTSTIPGFSNNGAVYFRFDDAIDTTLLPDAAGSLDVGAALMLVDVDPRSPHRGERIPVQWEWVAEAGAFRPGNQLAIAPVYGFPLRPSTTYAAIVTTEVAQTTEAFQHVFDPADPAYAAYAPLDDALFFLGLAREDVAVASVFTTQDPTEEMATIVAFLRNNLTTPDLDQRVAPIFQDDDFQAFLGHYPTPVFQQGTPPYRQTGGGFGFAANGAPIIDHWEHLRFALCTPLDLSAAPPGGWGIVIQQHGTGGDYLSHCTTDQLSVAAQLARVGLLSIGIDQPLHGTRATPDTMTDLDTFNYFNPESARTNQRQGAIDAVYLARALAAEPTTFTTDDGTEIPINPEKILFFGHSQGGTTGSLALPWLGTDTRGAVISGSGGGLAITLVERKDPVDIAQLIATTAGFAEGEVLTPMHPLASLVQGIVEATDPMNYAPFWFSQAGAWADQRPANVLLTSGLLDPYTPAPTAEALAAAARMPQLEPAANAPEALGLRGLSPVAVPTTGNVVGFDGSTPTAGLSQWPEQDHFAVFYEPDLAKIYRAFLASAADGMPNIGDTSP
jgi:hypothetical protein